MAAHRWKPSATVAAVIEHQGKFLLVEEHTPEGLRLNNPAGHLDPGESPQDACARETLEETAYAFKPTALVGIYLSRFERAPSAARPKGEDITYLRFAYAGRVGPHHPQRPLDDGIVRAVWLSLDEVRASVAQHRSEMVLQCIEDFVAGRRFALDIVNTTTALSDAAT